MDTIDLINIDSDADYPGKDETYKIIGICMEVHRILGFGFTEVVYKDAMEVEFIDKALPNVREVQVEIIYKEKKLGHKFFADFICFFDILVEVKSCSEGILREHIAQTLNYLRASGKKLALLINFGKTKLEFKRIIL
jgi:GxxExxY protein